MRYIPSVSGARKGFLLSSFPHCVRDLTKAIRQDKEISIRKGEIIARSIYKNLLGSMNKKNAGFLYSRSN